MIWIVLLVSLLLLVLTAIIYAIRWEKVSVNGADYPWRERRKQKSIDKLTDELLAEMTLKEKVAQLSGDGGPQFLLRLGINVLLLGRFPNTYSGRNTRLQIPPFSFSDGPRGVVVGQATCFPVALARAASWDVHLEQRIGDAIAKEVRTVGANYFGGLCINLLRHPAWGRAQECYGEDPWLTGEMAVSLLQSVQRHNVMVCAKHFAVNSIENSRFYLDVQIDKRSLHEVYLPHFKKCADAGVASMMSAYNKLNGEYCGHNEYLLTDVLRKQWGFKGFITSDWLWGIYETNKPVISGMDVEMPYARRFGKRLVNAVAKGAVEEKIIDRNTRRVIRSKLDFISRQDPQSYNESMLACDLHRHLAQEVAEKSMVLLKNENALLPLDKTQTQNIAVIGALANESNIGDHGSSRVSPPKVVTLLEGLQSYLKAQASHITISFDDGKNIPKACGLAKESDVVIVVAGYRHNDEGENLASNHKPGGKHKVAIGGDRPSLSLHQQDIQLINAISEVNKDILVTLISGSAVITEEWDKNVNAILMAWYPGMEGGHAFARLLFGDVNPSGKLPFSVPRCEQDLVEFKPFAETAHYGHYHGYTHLNKKQIEPAYAFGFGLSYTRFSYMMLTLDAQELVINEKGEHETLTVGMQIKNIGVVAGEEIVQLYVGFDAIAKTTGVERPYKLLRGFRKVNLEAEEDVVISFEISVNDLKRYDSISENWVLDKGEYQVMVGPSSDDKALIKEVFSVV